MTAKTKKQKLVLVTDVEPAKAEMESYETPWGRVWTRGSDVMATWKRHNFVPPSEYRNDYLFKINRDGGYKS